MTDLPTTEGAEDMQTATDIDTDARYRVSGWPKVAVYVAGYVRTPILDEYGEWIGEWLGDCEDAWNIDENLVRVVMVGDDIEHVVDVSDLEKVEDEDYCSSCGQIGCGWH